MLGFIAAAIGPPGSWCIEFARQWWNFLRANSLASWNLMRCIWAASKKGKGVYYGKKQKQVVVGLRQRKGPLRFIHTKDAKAKTLQTIIEEKIDSEVQYVMTDESSAAWAALKENPKHQVIRTK